MRAHGRIIQARYLNSIIAYQLQGQVSPCDKYFQDGLGHQVSGAEQAQRPKAGTNGNREKSGGYWANPAGVTLIAEKSAG